MANHLKNNFINWTSGDEKIDDFIQERQLKCKDYDAAFEWIPYNKFIDIEEIGDNCLTTAIWKEGPSRYKKNKWTRTSYAKVVLKYLFCSQNFTDEFLNEV